MAGLPIIIFVSSFHLFRPKWFLKKFSCKTQRKYPKEILEENAPSYDNNLGKNMEVGLARKAQAFQVLMKPMLQLQSELVNQRL